MSVLRWLSRLIGATLAWLFNAVLSLGLFLVSAYLFTLQDSDAAVPAYITRGIAAVWLLGATWHYVKHGIVQRPYVPAAARERGKVSTRQGVLASIGCVATLVGALAIAMVVGERADWVFAGLTGDDPAHPARVALEQASVELRDVAADPAPYMAGFLVVSAVLLMLRAVGRRPDVAPAEGGATTGQRRQRRRSDRREKARGGGPAGHAGASRAEQPSYQGPSSVPRVSSSGRTLTAPMLGTFRRDDASGGWRLLQPAAGAGDLFIEAVNEPEEAQLIAARGLVQRSFEVLLRASDAVLSSARADGVALPRFTIASSVGHGAGGPSPRVTVRLRDAGSSRLYEVVSEDGMQTFVSRGAAAPAR